MTTADADTKTADARTSTAAKGREMEEGIRRTIPRAWDYNKILKRVRRYPRETLKILCDEVGIDPLDKRSVWEFELELRKCFVNREQSIRMAKMIGSAEKRWDELSKFIKTISSIIELIQKMSWLSVWTSNVKRPYFSKGKINDEKFPSEREFESLYFHLIDWQVGAYRAMGDLARHTLGKGPNPSATVSDSLIALEIANVYFNRRFRNLKAKRYPEFRDRAANFVKRALSLYEIELDSRMERKLAVTTFDYEKLEKYVLALRNKKYEMDLKMSKRMIQTLTKAIDEVTEEEARQYFSDKEKRVRGELRENEKLLKRPVLPEFSMPTYGVPTDLMTDD